MNDLHRSPVIIIGMHRSGTSMLSRILEGFGLFMGVRKQRDHESRFFLDLNNWIFSQCGGSWDNPCAMHALTEHREARSLVAKYIRFILNSPRIANYLGWKNYLKYRTVENLNFKWGWKDPRNTFTLPLWLDLFPDAKIIHVYRNGVDVANSLHVREDARFSARKHCINHSYKKWIYILRPKRGAFADSLRCASLEGGFTLWEEYLQEAGRHVAALKERAMEIKYEDVLDEPYGIISALTAFCGLQASEKDMRLAAEQVKKSRAYAYKNTPGLLSFSEQVSFRLRQHGY